MSGLATTLDKRDTSNGNVHDGGSLRGNPRSLQDAVLSVKIATGSHIVPVYTQRRGQMAPLNDGF
jgi:hypothetical protein